MIPENIVKYFSLQNQISLPKAEETFIELEKFLMGASVGRVQPSKLVDLAWHAFILHTQDYAKYCTERFGCFIHHVPDDIEESGSEACSNCSSNCRGVKSLNGL